MPSRTAIDTGFELGVGTEFYEHRLRVVADCVDAQEEFGSHGLRREPPGKECENSPLARYREVSTGGLVGSAQLWQQARQLGG